MLVSVFCGVLRPFACLCVSLFDCMCDFFSLSVYVCVFVCLNVCVQVYKCTRTKNVNCWNYNGNFDKICLS